jgi:hypothetical protein
MVLIQISTSLKHHRSFHRFSLYWSITCKSNDNIRCYNRTTFFTHHHRNISLSLSKWVTIQTRWSSFVLKIQPHHLLSIFSFRRYHNRFIEFVCYCTHASNTWNPFFWSRSDIQSYSFSIIEFATLENRIMGNSLDTDGEYITRNPMLHLGLYATVYRGMLKCKCYYLYSLKRKVLYWTTWGFSEGLEPLKVLDLGTILRTVLSSTFSV